jgi:hypothetical protein
VLFGEGEEIGRRLGLEVLELHFPHAGVVLFENRPAAGSENAEPTLVLRRGRDRRSEEAFWEVSRNPMLRPAPNYSGCRNATASACVRGDATNIS